MSREVYANHVKSCALCLSGDKLMKADCVATYLGVSPISVRPGAAGTGCLFEGSFKQGRLRFWTRARVERHYQNLDEYGECDGSCKTVR